MIKEPSKPKTRNLTKKFLFQSNKFVVGLNLVRAWFGRFFLGTPEIDELRHNDKDTAQHVQDDSRKLLSLITFITKSLPCVHY